MIALFVLAVAVFALGLIPAFGPPAWVVVVFLAVHSQINPVAAVLVGAASITAGRVALALAARHFQSRLSPQRRHGLELLGQRLQRNGLVGSIGAAVFLFSPLPSAQLWEAVGLLGIPLRRIAAIFFVGRIFSLTVYIGVATLTQLTLPGAIAAHVTSGFVITSALALSALIAVVRFDWFQVLARGRGVEADRAEAG